MQLVEDQGTLAKFLGRRDDKRGGEFWLSGEEDSWPCLAIIVSDEWSDVTYFSGIDHPGFRCLRRHDDPPLPGVMTKFKWVGCDPADGVQTPNTFVLPFATSLYLAQEFFRHRVLPESAQWFEL